MNTTNSSNWCSNSSVLSPRTSSQDQLLKTLEICIGINSDWTLKGTLGDHLQRVQFYGCTVGPRNLYFNQLFNQFSYGRSMDHSSRKYHLQCYQSQFSLLQMGVKFVFLLEHKIPPKFWMPTHTDRRGIGYSLGLHIWAKEGLADGILHQRLG